MPSSGALFFEFNERVSAAIAYKWSSEQWQSHRDAIASRWYITRYFVGKWGRQPWDEDEDEGGFDN